MRKYFGDIICDNLSDEEYIKLRKMKRRKERDIYKIVITWFLQDVPLMKKLLRQKSV